LSEEIEGAAPAAPASETTTSAPAVEAREAPEQTFGDRLDADLSAAYDKLNTPAAERDESGRFKSKVAEALADPPEGAEATEPTTEAVEDQTPDAPAEEAKPSPISPPASWSAEMKAKWDKLPPDVQQYAVQRESESQQALSRLGNELGQLKGVRETVEQHRDLFEKRGISYKEGVTRLLNAQRLLETEPVRGLALLAQEYGVDLRSFGGQPDQYGQQQAIPPALVAEMERLRAEVRQTSARTEMRERQEAEAERTKLESLVADVAAKNPDFSLVENEVVRLVPIIREQNPGLSHKELLEKAIDEAGWVNPTVREQRLAKQVKLKADAEAKKATEAKRLASLNVKSNATARPGPKSMVDTIEAAYDRIQARG
jgi:hypothetical protein